MLALLNSVLKYLNMKSKMAAVEKIIFFKKVIEKEIITRKSSVTYV